MKSKLIPTLFLCLALLSPLFAEEKKGKSLVFDLPEGAAFEDKTNDRMEFYSITLKKEPMQGLLMIHASPAPVSEEMLKPMAEMMRLGFEKAMKENKEAPLKEIKSETREFKEGIWKGYEVKFLAKSEGGEEILQLMYVLWDGKRAWNAQFTGEEKDYDAVVKILGAIKLNDAAASGDAPAKK